MRTELAIGTFKALRTLITEETGIALHDGKRNFVAARLLHRIRALDLPTYDDYYAYVKASHAEREHLVNAITTNKTSFFREPHHFELLETELVPRLIARGLRTVRVWSAGCSSGEEAYSIAMTLLNRLPPGWDVKVLASDIDTEMLSHAAEGVYSAEQAASIPQALRTKFTETLDDGRVRMRPLLRSSVIVRRVNLNAFDLRFKTKFDAIFCRNVVIYFDQARQRDLFNHFARLMSVDGMLMLGHSETLHWMPETYQLIGRTVYGLRELDSGTGDFDIREVATWGGGIGAARIRTGETRGRVSGAVADSTPSAVRDARCITVGEVYASATGGTVRTVLGSCIATCLYDPVAQVGGMNHFLLPDGGDDEPTSARFGVHAMELLINAIMREGGDRRRLEAKIFGGSHVIELVQSKVSAKNVAFVRSFLGTENIAIRAELVDVGAPLDVCLFTDTGKVLARRLKGSAMLSVVATESSLVRRRPIPRERRGIVLF